MSLTKKVWEGLWTGAAASVFENLLRIPRMMIMTRVLGPEYYGVLGLLGMFREVTGKFIQMGSGDAVIRFMAEFKTRNETDRMKAVMGAAGLIRMAAILLCIGGCLYFEDAIAAFAAGFPAAKAVAPGDIRILLRLLLAGIVIQALEGPFGNALQGFQAWRALLAVRIISALAAAGLPIAAALLGYHLLGIVLAQQLSFALIAACILFYYWRIARPLMGRAGLTDKCREIKPVLLFGLPLIFSQIFRLVYTYTDQLMLATMSAGPEDLSYYEVARNAALMLVFVPTLLRSVMFPASAEFYAEKDVRRLEALFRFMVKHLFWFLTPLAVWMSALSPLAITLISGEKFLPAAEALTILALLMVMRAFGVPFFTCLVGALGRTREQFYISAAGGALNVFLNFFWIPRFGFMGAVYATAAGHLLGFSLAVLFLTPHMKLHFPLRAMAVSLFWALAGAAVLAASGRVHPYAPLVCLAPVSLAYAAGVSRMGVLDGQDLSYLSRMVPAVFRHPLVEKHFVPHVRPVAEVDRI